MKRNPYAKFEEILAGRISFKQIQYRLPKVWTMLWVNIGRNFTAFIYYGYPTKHR